MTTGTYGLGIKPLSTTQRGAGLAGVAGNQLSSATAGLGQVAQMDTQREIMNGQRKQEAQAGNAQLGATVGGIAGSYWGPAGAAVGSALGGVLGGLF